MYGWAERQTDGESVLTSFASTSKMTPWQADRDLDTS